MLRTHNLNKIRVRLLSDLHLDVCPYKLCYRGEDILVLAGDLTARTQVATRMIERYLEDNAEPDLVFVLGNHDYYESSVEQVQAAWTEFASRVGPRFHWLENRAEQIRGTWFWGSTMWTNVGDQGAAVSCQTGMNDYRQIQGPVAQPWAGFNTWDSDLLHLQSRVSLMAFLNSVPIDNKVVVVTHHLPCYQSILPQYTSAVNAAYASTDLEEALSNPRVNWWLHGHTHACLDYVAEGGTRVICNPRGYNRYWRDPRSHDVHIKSRENKAFDETLMFDI